MKITNSSQDLLPTELAMDAVTLKVGDLAGMSRYYQQALGLEVLDENADGVRLGRAGRPLVTLAPAAGLQLPGRGEAGLFHTALLFEDRADLAATVATAAQFDASLFTGSADHLVSEAFYFNDPEGNGIELYFDRPRESWHWDGDTVRMATNPLNPQRYLLENLDEAAVSGQRTATAAVGHVHLQVGEVAKAEEFYVRVLGFEKTASIGDQALFVSAGGYHHHMAMNVWNSRGAGPRRDTLGLGEVRISLPRREDVGALQERLSAHRIASDNTGAELRFKDPWLNQIRVTVETEKL